ncbi:MAG: GAF domain-containing protein [Anaerolineae bacterium]|nr:GAF domain-containing protein [Anaerolineae bacterium]
MVDQPLESLQAEVEILRIQVAQLTAINNIALRLGTTLDFDSFLTELVRAFLDYGACKRAFVFVPDETDNMLHFGSGSAPLADVSKQMQLEHTRLPIYNPEPDSLINAWLEGRTTWVRPGNPDGYRAHQWLSDVLDSHDFIGLPLCVDGRLMGVIVVDNQPDGTALSEDVVRHLELLSPSAAISLKHARLHRRTALELADNMREMYILRQIDRELNETIDLNHVFEMTLDWALRFTNAQASSLAMYNQETDELRFLIEYGYDRSREQLAQIRQEYGAGITHRVARSGYADVIPDVSMDKDFVRLATNTRSILSVPVMREDRVVAVITLESKKLNGFTDAHLNFVEKLATRAGVAIDNARLYDESLVEREKLSHILNNTADIVIVITTDERVLLINQSAISALHMYPNTVYAGRTVRDVFEATPLLEVFETAKQHDDPNLVYEVKMPNDRIFNANLRHFEGIGWIIVMHDITPFKEMDRLKSELIATVSHDLKQPLSVMNGYIELLLMQQNINTQGMNSVNMVRKAIQNMRQLIDDLLDLAKIESGIQLNLAPVGVGPIIADCVDQVRPAAQNKAMTVVNLVTDNLPSVMGDRARLRQILVNLIGNAVKYTQPEGTVRILAERRGPMLRIAIQDNGMGISPEDQIHVFDRFYRVRRPETDSIEGTGLGLAIVKSLVEAHKGQIGLDSRLGEGSTFYVTIPIAEPA